MVSYETKGKVWDDLSKESNLNKFVYFIVAANVCVGSYVLHMYFLGCVSDMHNDSRDKEFIGMVVLGGWVTNVIKEEVNDV
jgi:hypothetical protein